MAKKARTTKAPRGAEEADWIDDLLALPIPEAVAGAESLPALPQGDTKRTLRQLEVSLLPTIGLARDVFRAIATGTPPRSPPDPAIASIFTDYRHYLIEWRISLIAAGEEPNEAFTHHDAMIGQLLDCFGKVVRKEPVKKVEAVTIARWLGELPAETLLFN
jgi:hypothetical protein